MFAVWENTITHWDFITKTYDKGKQCISWNALVHTKSINLSINITVPEAL